MSDTPLVSVVVVTYNSASVIDECLAGLVGDPRVEVIVVDSGSDDDSAGKAGSFDEVVSIAMEENLGKLAFAIPKRHVRGEGPARPAFNSLSHQRLDHLLTKRL